MSRYDRQYDFGLRGYPQTIRAMMDSRAPRYDRGYRGGYDPRAFQEQRFNTRVTARYNRDYVTGYRDDRPIEYNLYAGDHMRRPYTTLGGTRTMRGSSFPAGYDYPDYGPNYGGRFPDEL